MGNWLINFFAPGLKLPPGSQEWNPGFEGLAPGWAFLIFLALAAACIWAYRRYAPEITHRRRGVLIALRLLALALLLFLLTKPVLNITVNEAVRQNLLVLLDASKSMDLSDHRVEPDDLKRAGLLTGQLDPAKGLNQGAPGDAAALADAKRWDLLEKLAANKKLNLWPRLHEKSEIVVFPFGRDATAAGALGEPGTPLTAAQAVEFFKRVRPEAQATAIGEGLSQVLDQNRGQAVSGVLLITDGCNNSGLPPVEAARVASEQNVPLFIYGIGVTSPADLIIRDLKAPRMSFLKEKVVITCKVQIQGLTGKSTVVTLEGNGEVLDTKKMEITGDGEFEVTFEFVPDKIGDLNLEVSAPVLPEEVGKDNNTATGKMRIVDNKLNVLLIEQEPRWDFRYLLSYLQRDRRLQVKAVLVNGEPDLDQYEDSPFLAKLPEDREGIFKNEIIILGDVNPEDLGETRMKLIRDWVEQTSGGIIFLAGPNYNPTAYVGTPLETLLPVIPHTGLSEEDRKFREKELIKLQLTAAGETSSYLQLSEDPVENRRIWDSFPGVRWTAPVVRAKPGAQVLLVDPRSDRATQDGPMPVFAMQSYGSGECVFIGTDETYRWRSHIGEKYYSQIWGLIMQSLSMQRLQSASSRTQLKTEKERYFAGDKVRISGKVFKENFEPLATATLDATAKIITKDAAGKEVEKQVNVEMSAVPDKTGEYRGEFLAQAPGEYRFATLQDPTAIVKFDVIEPKLEQMETAMNDRLLKAMAESGHGKFLREEDLNKLPDFIAERSATVATFKTIPLYYSAWWVVFLLALAFAEWTLRRVSQLK